MLCHLPIQTLPRGCSLSKKLTLALILWRGLSHFVLHSYWHLVDLNFSLIMMRSCIGCLALDVDSRSLFTNSDVVCSQHRYQMMMNYMFHLMFLEPVGRSLCLQSPAVWCCCLGQRTCRCQLCVVCCTVEVLRLLVHLGECRLECILLQLFIIAIAYMKWCVFWQMTLHEVFRPGEVRWDAHIVAFCSHRCCHHFYPLSSILGKNPHWLAAQLFFEIWLICEFI